MASVAKDLSLQVAIMVSKSTVLDDVADEVLAAAKAEAGLHRRTGYYGGSFYVTKDANPEAKGVIDRLVVNDAEYSADLEMGHLDIGLGAKTGGGSILRWVQGLHILRNAGLAVAAKHGWVKK